MPRRKLNAPTATNQEKLKARKTKPLKMAKKYNRLAPGKKYNDYFIYMHNFISIYWFLF
jgi:hypothetical protein